MCIKTTMTHCVKAKKDITVYVVRVERQGLICSPFNDYVWEKDLLYETVNVGFCTDIKHADYGFHSYKNVEDAINLASYLSHLKRYFGDTFQVRRAIIPITAWYREGYTKDIAYNNRYDGKDCYCSNKLIMKEVLYEM